MGAATEATGAIEDTEDMGVGYMEAALGVEDATVAGVADNCAAHLCISSFNPDSKIFS